MCVWRGGGDKIPRGILYAGDKMPRGFFFVPGDKIHDGGGGGGGDKIN